MQGKTAPLTQPQSTQTVPLMDVHGRQARITPVATLSAGYMESRGGKEYPKASKDGRMYINGLNIYANNTENISGTALEEILKQSGGKQLTIALATNDPHEAVSQMFISQSKTRLLAFGDEHSITEFIEVGRKGNEPITERHVHIAGTPDYHRVKALCDVGYFLYFRLAIWTTDCRPVPFCPDDLTGYYALRTTSFYTASNLVAVLTNLKNEIGVLKGVPIEVTLQNQRGSDSMGAKREYPVFRFKVTPPDSLISLLLEQNGSKLAAQALALKEIGRRAVAFSREMHALEAANPPEPEAPLEPTTMEAAYTLINNHNPAAFIAQFHGLAKGTPFGLQESPARAKLIGAVTGNITSSLSELAHLQTPEAEGFREAALLELSERVEAWHRNNHSVLKPAQLPELFERVAAFGLHEANAAGLLAAARQFVTPDLEGLDALTYKDVHVLLEALEKSKAQQDTAAPTPDSEEQWLV